MKIKIKKKKQQHRYMNVHLMVVPCSGRMDSAALWQVSTFILHLYTKSKEREAPLWQGERDSIDSKETNEI